MEAGHLDRDGIGLEARTLRDCIIEITDDIVNRWQSWESPQERQRAAQEFKNRARRLIDEFPG